MKSVSAGIVGAIVLAMVTGCAPVHDAPTLEEVIWEDFQNRWRGVLVHECRYILVDAFTRAEMDATTSNEGPSEGSREWWLAISRELVMLSEEVSSPSSAGCLYFVIPIGEQQEDSVCTACDTLAQQERRHLAWPESLEVTWEE